MSTLFKRSRRTSSSSSFRNLLHLKYKSSTKSKTKRRQKSQQMIAEVRRVSAESLAGANNGFYTKSSVNSHFDQANQMLLGQIKSSNKNNSAAGQMSQFAQIPYGSRFAPLFQQYLTGAPLGMQQRVGQLNHPPMTHTSGNLQPSEGQQPHNFPPPALESLQSDFSRSMLADFLTHELFPIDENIFDDDCGHAAIPVTATSKNNNNKVHDLAGMHLHF